jgi:hypothetical protein
MIRIKRDSGYTDSARAYKVVRDGNVVGKINDDQWLELEVAPGKHQLQMKIDWCYSNMVDFEMGESDIEFQCGSNLRGFKILLALYYLIFSDQYIWLRLKS